MEESSGHAAHAITTLGITAEAVTDALDRELVGTLAAVGVESSGRTRFARSGDRRVPRWGQSAKLALKRALEEAVRLGDRAIHGEHLLVAIAGAEAGRIPRLLVELGIDEAQVRAALSADGDGD